MSSQGTEEEEHLRQGSFEAKPHKFTDAASALKFMLGGKATVTIRSKVTQTRFTYLLKVAPDPEGKGPGRRGLPTFVGLLNGPDNDSSYQYMGNIFPDNFEYEHGRKAKMNSEAPGAKAFAWTWAQLQFKGVLPDSVEVWHEARCGRCGRKLTVPESIESGFGPECIGKVGG